MAKKSQPTREQVVDKCMVASVALFELNELVREFERAGGRESMATNPSWLPFLETLDALVELDGKFQGLSNSVFDSEFAESEGVYDNWKEGRSRK